MDWTTRVIAVELLALGLAWVYIQIRDWHLRAAVRRLDLYAHTQHPIVNTSPPTNLVTIGPDEWVLPLE